jgi:hypothetical protein
MSTSSSDFKQRLIEALKWFDEQYRDDKAERLIWLSQFQAEFGLIASDRLEPLSLLEEARVCFVNGNFIAALLVATSYIEQIIVSELVDQSIGGPRDTLQKAIETARSAKLFAPKLLDGADQLRLIRNPFVHRKPDGYVHSLTARFRAQDIHPDKLLEADAKLALELMYGYFHSTLRRMD